MTRDLDAFLAGSRRRDEAELHATRDIIHTALSKAQEKKAGRGRRRGNEGKRRRHHSLICS
ncbi:MAG: hypothetical protein M5R36_24075 [Deltaproteobacteria bacterium]|nr:hypothetical protein [Deltaproteobacteria bacterium]